MSTAETRLLHLHLPKTGGTSIRRAFNNHPAGLKVYTAHDDLECRKLVPDDYDVISGHFGFDMAKQLGGHIISVFRDPYDSFVSLYYFWRYLHNTGIGRIRRTMLAATHTLDEFAMLRNEPCLIPLSNRVTWQIACGYSDAQRREKQMAGMTDADILARAKSNLRTLSLIGVQDRIGDFVAGVHAKFDLDLSVRRVNVTDGRIPLTEVSAATRSLIDYWVGMDLEIYRLAKLLAFRPAYPESGDSAG